MARKDSKGFTSARELQALRPREKDYEIRYSPTPGLLVRVSTKGVKTFYFRYIFKGRRRTIHIGQFPAWSLKEASQISLGYRTELLRGVCPWSRRKAEKDAEKAAEVQELERRSDEGTLRDILHVYVLDLDRNNRRSVGNVASMFRSSLLQDPVADKLPGDAESTELLRIVREMELRSPSMAAQLLAYLKASIRFAKVIHNKTDWADPAAWPDGRIKTFSELGKLYDIVASIELNNGHRRARERVISEDEIRSVWAATDPRLAPLKLLLSTGQRVEEVLGMSLAEVDFEAGTWTIPAGRRKNTRKAANLPDHIVPLCDFQLQLIEEIADRSRSETLLFPRSDSDFRPVTAKYFSRIVKEWQERNGTEYRFVAKDCRRTFKTYGGKLGLPLEIRNRLQGHALTDIGSVHYDKHDYLDQKREAMQRYTAWLTELLAHKN